MNRNEWVEKCGHWKNKWPVIQEEYLITSDRLNIYAVLDAVNRYSTSEHILMGDAGSISYAGPVALKSKADQRFIFSPAQADMGWGLPAAIGAAMASNKPIISIIGDGSFMSNLQELAVVRFHDLDIKFIILNNGGYLSIKNTQTKYFQGRVYGTSDKTGLWFPDFRKVAETFHMEYFKIDSNLDSFSSILSKRGPAIVDCFCLEEQEILPAQALKNGKQAGLHDMTPFLSDQELSEEMVVNI